jgi:phosphate butyryltransferase
MIHSFLELEEQAIAKESKKIALTMAEEADALTAVVNAAQKNIVTPILVGDEAEIRRIAEAEKIAIADFEVVHAAGGREAAATAVELVRSGKADLLMKGKVPTPTIMKAALNRETGIRGEGILSHVTILETSFYHKFLFMSDPALNIAPDVQTKAAIIKNAVYVCNKLGIERPKVAVIGAIEKVNPAMEATLDAAILSKMAHRDQIQNCIVDGPFALDNAISAKSCSIKGIETEVGGDADILLMPDIEAANVFYKSFAYLSDARMAAVVIGANAPIILSSRADSDTIKYLSILSGVSLA